MKGSQRNEWLATDDKTIPTPAPEMDAPPPARRAPHSPAAQVRVEPAPVIPALPDPSLLSAPATPRVVDAPSPRQAQPPMTERMAPVAGQPIGVRGPQPARAAQEAEGSPFDPNAFAVPPPLFAPSAQQQQQQQQQQQSDQPSLAAVMAVSSGAAPSPAIGTRAPNPSDPRASASDGGVHARGYIPGENPESRFGEIKIILKEFLHRHEAKIWWLHTAYAFTLGAFVAAFASKGFERARILALSLGAVWLLVVFFFRFFGTGARQDFMTAWPGMRRRFFIMSYFMKNLFQSMLFFLLPFYYKTVSLEAKNYYIFVLLSACAVLSTLDLVFDRVLLRFKVVASAFFATTLFGCMNLVIPALLPNTPVIVTLLLATGLSVATFALFHMSLERLKRPITASVFAGVILLGVLGAYMGRRSMPPVPLALKDGGVGTTLREDGTLAVEVKSIREGSVNELYAVTDVQVIGTGEKFHHVWRKVLEQGEGQELKHNAADVAAAKEHGVVRVASRLDAENLPSDAIGKYYVDVETDSGQIVARVIFEIKAK